MSKNAIIIGMPRSGTSMTTNIFAKSGYFIAEDVASQLRTGDQYNPSGYWEAEPLITANAEIFSKVGYENDNTWLYDAISDKQANDIYLLAQDNQHKALVETYNANAPWVWKDPRLCYTISYWWPLMNKDTTGVLLLKRNHDEIYNSFLRLKWRKPGDDSKQDVKQRINKHIESAEKALKKYNVPHIVVDYADFQLQPEKTANMISQFFGLTLSTTDLGFDKNLNTSNLRGKFTKFSDSVGDILPDNLRKFIKNLIPMFIWKMLYPNKSGK